MSGGWVLLGGPLDGREIDNATELQQAQERTKPEGAYTFETRQSREGRFVLRFRHSAPDDA